MRKVEDHMALVYYWAGRLAREIDNPNYRAEDFIGWLTIRLHKTIEKNDEATGQIHTLFAWNILPAAMYQLVWKDSDHGQSRFKNNPQRKERTVKSLQSTSKEVQERLPAAVEEVVWTDIVCDHYDTPEQLWDFLTEGMEPKQKQACMLFFRDGLRPEKGAVKMGRSVCVYRHYLRQAIKFIIQHKHQAFIEAETPTRDSFRIDFGMEKPLRSRTNELNRKHGKPPTGTRWCYQCEQPIPTSAKQHECGWDRKTYEPTS